MPLLSLQLIDFLMACLSIDWSSVGGGMHWFFDVVHRLRIVWQWLVQQPHQPQPLWQPCQTNGFPHLSPVLFSQCIDFCAG